MVCSYIERDACNRKKVCSFSERSYESGAYSYKEERRIHTWREKYMRRKSNSVVVHIGRSISVQGDIFVHSTVIIHRERVFV